MDGICIRRTLESHHDYEGTAGMKRKTGHEGWFVCWHRKSQPLVSELVILCNLLYGYGSLPCLTVLPVCLAGVVVRDRTIDAV
jgi:hypothetical protein